VVVVLAGLITPLGFSSLPVVAGVIAALFGLSPFVWMMHWFADPHFAKAAFPLLEVRRHGGWLVGSSLVVGGYLGVLGRGVPF
jgi:hypothetical protein